MSQYWKTLISRLGRKVLYVDTGAILGSVECGNDQFQKFFSTAVGYRYVTSTYVVTETVRRLVKTKTPNQFCGPGGERCKDLSLYILKAWLEEHDVYVICLPDDEFDEARNIYRDKHFVNCDLTDIISYTIILGLDQNQILSDDSHFNQLGLVRLP